MQKVVTDSAECNECQLVGTEDGEVLVQTYDWTAFLGSMFKKLDGILSFQHFRFSPDGTVHAKHSCEGQEKAFPLLKKGVVLPLQHTLPPVIQPPGLPLARQWYLFDEIRQFVAPEHQDRVAPQPSLPKPSKAAVVPDTDNDNYTSNDNTIDNARGRGRGARGGRGRGARGGRGGGRGRGVSGVLTTHGLNFGSDTDGEPPPKKKQEREGGS